MFDIFDMHFHTSPDIVAWKLNDIELAERFKATGFKGAVIKRHYADTAGRKVRGLKTSKHMTL